jgi:uncharacterized glyoxalase superfamily protein PhnB
MDTTPPTHPQTDPATLGEHAGHVIYAMPAFARVASPDPVRLVRFFTTALDFSVLFAAPDVGGAPMLVHLRRAKYQDILVVPSRPSDAGVAPDTALVVTFAAADADEVDVLATRVAAAAPDASTGAVDTPWSTRDLTVTDPDGRAWSFTARGRGPMQSSIGATMDAVKNATARG